MNRPELTRTQRRLVGVVVGGALLLAAIGFAGSYAAVRALAVEKGFGDFALAFPIGLDAGIVVLLCLDLLLAWLRMPFPLLRQTAWLLTGATIAFNAAAAWPDPLGVGMHAVIPLLFVIVVEAARHAIGIAAEITADQRMEPVRLARWLLAPWPTFRLWRRMKLWELRSYEDALRLEQDRLEYRAALRAEYGIGWRWSAPIERRLALRLARHGRPLAPVTLSAPDAPAPTVQRAPVVNAPAPVLERPAPQPALEAPRPERPAPTIEGAAPAPRPAPEKQSAPDERPAPAPRPAPHPSPAPTGEQGEHPVPTRAEMKEKIRALYDELDGRPAEGQIVALLKSHPDYPHQSRRHAQKLRGELEAVEPGLAARGSDNVTALPG